MDRSDSQSVFLEGITIVRAANQPLAGAAALIAGIAAAWKGCRLITVAGICCAVVFVLELFL